MKRPRTGRRQFPALITALLTLAFVGFAPAAWTKDTDLPEGMSPDSRAAKAIEKNDDERRDDDSKSSKSDDRDDEGHEAHHGDGEKANHGQRVSECSHRANQRNLKGHDRQDFVEWCVDRGERWAYDDRRYREQRSCYRIASDRGYSGDRRRAYVHDCLEREERGRKSNNRD
jgi:hypothetical protein